MSSLLGTVSLGTVSSDTYVDWADFVAPGTVPFASCAVVVTVSCTLAYGYSLSIQPWLKLSGSVEAESGSAVTCTSVSSTANAHVSAPPVVLWEDLGDTYGNGWMISSTAASYVVARCFLVAGRVA